MAADDITTILVRSRDGIQPHEHEHTIGVFTVRAKRPTGLKTHASIEALGSAEVRMAAGFEKKLFVFPVPGHLENMREQGAAGATATHGFGRAHRLDFALRPGQFLQSRTAQERFYMSKILNPVRLFFEQPLTGAVA